jgi:uncharacterized membrane protein YhiD involved in acid resistance
LPYPFTPSTLPPVVQEFQQINLFPTTPADIIINLLMALLCGFILSITYRVSYRGPSYSITYVNSLIMLALISAMVVLVIGNNVARAFGLVGALSIIRFRTAIRDTMDLVFIFLSLVVGMASGVGLSFVALLGTILSSLIIFMLQWTHFSAPRRRYHLLQIKFNTDLTDNEKFTQLLNRFCSNVRLVALRNVDDMGNVEGHYHVVLRKQSQSPDLINLLTREPHINQAYIYFDEDDYNAPTL